MDSENDRNASIRWVDWLSGFLLAVLIQVAAGRLAATQWTKNLALVQVVALLGTILGLALGKSIFKRFWVAFLGLSYGLVVIPWQLGLTMDHELRWKERLLFLLGRLEVVFRELITRKPVTDNLLFLLLMTILFWSLAVYAGYILFREGNPWKALIPGGITAFVIHSFDPLLTSRSWYLAFYLFISLLLVARSVFLNNSRQWKERHTHTPPDLGFDFSRFALALSVVLVFFAWNIPVVAQAFKPAAQIWQTASKPWLTAKDRMSFAFASLKASVGLVQNYYGDTLPLGLGNPLSDQVVIEVKGPTDSPNGANFYWEARTYGTYEGNQWLTNIKEVHDLTADSVDLNQPGAENRAITSFSFFPHAAISNLYTVPEPLWVNIPSQATMTVNQDGSVNNSAWMSKGFIFPGESYTVRSAVDNLTLEQLRNAGTGYPQWVVTQYLQLPENLTPRTRELAKSIAIGLGNPYDIAEAVTDYLRQNIVYDQSVSLPPPNQERIDWFLFDYKRGFCNYYASAEVLMLRSLGIPARLAVGYAQGEREVPPIQNQPTQAGEQSASEHQISETATYVVRQRDAHAWPEVFFPSFGWITFEPTVSQPVMFRPSAETNKAANQKPAVRDPQNTGVNPNQPNPLDQLPADKANPSTGAAAQSFWSLGNILLIILLLATIALLVVVIWQVRRGFKLVPFVNRLSQEIPVRLEVGMRRMGIRPPGFIRRWIDYQSLPSLSRSYLEINHALHRVGIKPSTQQTPSERAVSLMHAIPSAAIPTGQLLKEYETSIYSPHAADEESARKAGMDIRRKSWIAWLSRLLARFQEPVK